MKSKFSFLTIVLLSCLTLPAFGQRGFDAFYVPREQVVATPQAIAASSTITTAIDTHGYQGIANVTFFCVTNTTTGLGTVTALLESSSDTNTWTAVSYGKAVSTSVSYTNSALGNGTNVAYTDTYLLPGTWTTPTAATAGWATRYLAPVALTTTAAISLTPTAPSGIVVAVGYNITDAGRYLRCTFTATSACITNADVGAVLTGMRANE